MKRDVARRIRAAAGAITRLSGKPGRPRIELERVCRDVELVAGRFAVREYLHTSFHRNLLDIPDRTAELHSDLRFLTDVGRIWSELFIKAKLRERDSILDLGCGFFPKVELGLYYAGFRGTVTMQDVSKEALRDAGSFLQFFDVPFTARALPGSIWARAPRTRSRAVVANHLLDDLLLSRSCARRGVRLRDVYRDEHGYLAAVEAMVADEAFGQRVMREFAAVLDRLVAREGVILLLDYPSFSHRTLRLRRLFAFVSRMQGILRAELTERGFSALRPLARFSSRHGRISVDSRRLIAYSR